jgi:hypothetical protein
VTSVASFQVFANATNASAVAFVDLPQPFSAGSRRLVSKSAGLDGEVNETTDRIASTLPCKLGIGPNAGG